jgi:fimbrial isopeptide formation D2 family protein
MFKKLVSNLPFNPGLLQQLAFYGTRLRREKSLRKLSFGFMAATMVVNVFAVSIPAKNSLATSLNDIVYGATTKSSVLTAYKNNRDSGGRTDIRAIFNYYGITEADIAAASSVTVKSTDRNYVTTGRWESPGDDDPQSIPGAQTTVYERNLRVWDIKNPYNTYPAITGTASGNGKLKGQTFWILLKGCGNVTYVPQPKTPKVEIRKTLLSADKLRVGDSVSYRIDYRNPGNAAAKDIAITDTLSGEVTFLNANPTPSSVNGKTLTWRLASLEPSSEFHQITITATINAITTANGSVCNVASVSSSNAGSASSTNVCVTIDNTCPGTNLPIPEGGLTACTVTCPDGTVVLYNEINKCPVPVVACEILQLVDRPDWNQRTVRLTTKSSAGAVISKVSFLLDGAAVGERASPKTNEEFTYQNLSEGSHTYSVDYSIKTGSLQTGSSCIIKDTVEKPVPGISAQKSAKNTSKGVDDATKATASAGNVIEYTVTTTNSGTGPANGYIIKPDGLGRVLEYADLAEIGDANFDKTSQQLSWPAIDIKPGQSVTKVFSVKVKSPIPANAPSQSDPAGFQYKMCNTYGNEVCINVEKPVPAVIRGNVESLPNTGPGTSMVITFMAMLIIGFFYARSRILAKEVDIIRYDYAKGV